MRASPQETSLPTLHRTGSTPSNDNRAGHAGETIYETSPGTLSRLRQLAGGEGEGGAFGVLVEDPTIDLRARGSGVKRAWRLASALCLGILLVGLTAHAAPWWQAAAFTSQCSGDGFQIDLAGAQDANLGQDHEERVEQLRDWIWPVLLARLEATAGLEGLLIGSATQPLIRDDALAHVLDHPVGSTRSGIARDGTVVVMVQVDEPAVMQEALLEAIDQESLNLGAVPRHVLVYRYDIDRRTDHARLCRLGSFDALWIESQQQGFRRATVRKADDLESFLDGGVDLLSAQCTEQGLEVTGRVRARVRKAPMTVEHVASLYQPSGNEYVPTAKLGVSFAGLPYDRRAKIERMASYIDDPFIRADDEPDADIRQMFFRVRQWKYLLHPQVDTRELLLSWITQRESFRDLGFSLDPKLQASDVMEDIHELLAALEDPRKLAALLHAWRVEPRQAAQLVEIMQMSSGARALVTRDLTALLDGLRWSRILDPLGALSQMMYRQDSPEQQLLAVVATMLHEHASYQCARYDGPLQGTEVGMTMFYTDLLMKLWAGDLWGSAPDGLVPGFESVVGHDLSAAYCTTEEMQYPHTRAWLGLREEQYIRESLEGVRFAPVATRVFGRGSQLGAGYSAEMEASAAMRRFHRWWNAHYARVAEWEPQYELLNQIMKWSVVAQVEAIPGHLSCLGFVAEIPVDRSQRFDQWVATHEELRWRGPVALVKREDEPTECISTLRSRWYPSCDGEGYLLGGVSAASRATITGRPVLQARQARELGRLDAMSPLRPTVASGGTSTYDAVPRPDGKLTRVEIDPGRRTLTARVDTAQSQRGPRHSYSADRPVVGVKKSWRLDRGKLDGKDALDARGHSFGVSQLAADDVTAGAVRVQVKPTAAARMREIGQTAADQLAAGKKLSGAAPGLPGVTAAVKLDDHRVLLTVVSPGESTPTYMILSSGTGIRGPPLGSLALRIGSRAGRRGQGAVKVELLSEAEARALSASRGASPLAKGRRPRIDQFEQALATGDYARAERLFVNFQQNGSADEAIEALEEVRRQAARAGKDTAMLEALKIRASIRHGRPQGPVRESKVLPADGDTFIVPSAHARRYADLAALPPGVNPATRAGTAPRAFHARAISESPASAQLPSEVRIDGVEYTVLRRAAQAAGGAGLLYVIYACRQAGEPESSDTVECQGRTAARRVDEESRAALRTLACRLGPKLAKSYGVTDCK
jgi:hypothetical protein